MAAPKKSTEWCLYNGVTVPTLGLGTWKSKPGEVAAAVKHALLNAGYRHIDCALVYQNEHEVGQALKEVFESGALKREEVFITSKLWNTFHSRASVMEGVKKSLANLGLEYLDLYLIHWPMGFQEGDNLFPRDDKEQIIFSNIDYLETWKGMEDVQKAGLSKSIGVSNFNSEQIQRVLDNCEIKPVMNQIEVHPYLTQQPLIDFCRERQIGITAYSPLGSPDRPWAKPEDPSLLEDPAIKSLAAKYNKTSAQILLRYANQRGLFVIPKSVTPSRIDENINIYDFKLTPEEIESINQFNKNWRAVPVLTYSEHPYYPFKRPF
ncbi:aldo-keto reductase family 1 member B1-like [Panonychus citri]|uniref:aldo-keto reductase family 1 member B1-like n=1 Tax=Panonychus citri TaxID=50023 RepID=UPI0023070108|nr:aldo-keto reductase family 1 member B1-like [Panonychus citri]